MQQIMKVTTARIIKVICDNQTGKYSRAGAHRVQGSWKAKEFPRIVPYYAYIRGHGDESLPGTCWWVWSWGL